MPKHREPAPVQDLLFGRNDTRLVNVRRQPGWKRDRRYVYVGRRAKVDPRTLRPGDLGSFGNPFPMGAPPDGYTKAEALRLCEEYLRERVATDPAFAFAVHQLEGKILGCYCVKDDGSGDCHGRIYLKLLAERRAAKAPSGDPNAMSCSDCGRTHVARRCPGKMPQNPP